MEFQVAYHLTLNQEDYSGLSGGLGVITKVEV